MRKKYEQCKGCGRPVEISAFKVRFSLNGKFLTLTCDVCGYDLGTWIIFEA